MTKESLNEFITRFTSECQKIQDLPPSQQIAGFIYGIDKDRYPTLYYWLKRKLPKVFSEAIAMARGYLRSGEDTEIQRAPARDHSHGDRDRYQGRSHDGGSGSSRRDHGGKDFRRDTRHDNRRHEQRRQPYDKNTLLSSLTKTPKEILLTEVAARSTFNTPPPMDPRDGPKNGKYCDFHEEFGHDTDDCRQLKKEVKAAIQAGKLNHLLPGKRFKKADGKKTFACKRRTIPETLRMPPFI